MTQTANYSTPNYIKHQCRHPFAIKILNEFYTALNALISRIDPEFILNIGCGEGFDIKNICQRQEPPYCCGLDINLEALKLAKNLLVDLPFDAVHGNIYNLPFHLKKFDIILCLEVLEHLETPKDVLREVSQNFSGSCIFSVPNEPLNRLTRLIRFGQNIRRFGSHPEHRQHWSRSSFSRLVGKYFIIDEILLPFPWTMIRCHTREI